jgi:hypothetical protein
MPATTAWTSAILQRSARRSAALAGTFDLFE